MSLATVKYWRWGRRGAVVLLTVSSDGIMVGAVIETQVGHNVRLLTSVLISHQVWSEACDVEINIALAIPEADIGKKKTVIDATPTLLDLCKPVKVSVAPKPIKKTL